MKKDENTPSFIHELKLTVLPKQLKALDIRLDVARQVYNACLGESLKRLKLMRESKIYREAKMAKGKERQDKFKEVREKYRFSEYEVHYYVAGVRNNTWLAKHIDAHTAQKVATRAFDAVAQYCYGKKGKPRFKGKNQFSSIEGKSNKAGIRFIDGKIIWGKKLAIIPKYDLKDKHGLESYVLSCPTKYVRLLRRNIKGNPVWYAQLIQKGTPYQKSKNVIKNSVVGLDIGPSSIAMVSVGSNHASLQAFCPQVNDYRKKIGRIQRKMSRSSRVNNPDNFEVDKFKKNSNGRRIKKLGKCKKGVKNWVGSNKYKAMRAVNAELQRKMAATRKTSHGEFVNKVLSIGNVIKTEKLSYVAFQKNYGKSVGFRAPGLFVEILKRKAASAGGKVIEFNTRTTRLSQSCQCGNQKKKLLKDRWHHCDVCGIKAQRDLYSAYLAEFVEENRLDTSQAKQAWASAGTLLEQAVSSLNETANSQTCLASFGLSQRQSGLLVKKESAKGETLDVVSCVKAQERAKESLLSCP